MNNLQFVLVNHDNKLERGTAFVFVLNGGMLEFFLFSSERLGARICQLCTQQDFGQCSYGKDNML